jgi:osmotically-inducible protein OsmY
VTIIKCKITLPLKLAVDIVALSGLVECAAVGTCGPGECQGDADISSAVEARLSRNPALQPPNLLRVQTHNHIVYLYGLVDTPLERNMAESAALDTPGVVRVVNSIGISGSR